MRKIEKRFCIIKYSLKDIENCIIRNHFEKNKKLDESECYTLKYEQVANNLEKVETIQPDCALFYQLLHTVDGVNRNSSMIDLYNSIGEESKDVEENKKREAKLLELSGVLSDKLIYIDFAYASLIKEDVKKGIFENGITFTYEDNRTVKYVYFEASGSMRRGATLSFIDERYKDEMIERLTFGMPDDNKKISLSKYWAYKGLYLTSGHRINTAFGNKAADNDDVVAFNDKTVVIIDDYEDSSVIDRRIGFESADDCQGDVYFSLDINGEKAYHRTDEDYVAQQVKLFDGEGLISQKYSEIIARAIKNKGDANIQNYSSFQVRAPFIKGMLHKISDVTEGEKTTPGLEWFFKKFNVSTITDVFGKEHNVADVEIVLTKSMFKCFDWIPKGVDAGWFWNNCNKYDHALYIAGSNNPGRVPVYTSLNSQVLSTCGMSNDDFDAMVWDFYESALKIKNDDYALLAYLSDIYRDASELDNEEENSENDDQETDDDSQQLECQEKGNLYYQMIKKNPAVVRTTAVRLMRYDLFNKELSEFALAHIPVKGGYFYLSGNLMDLLFRMTGASIDFGRSETEKLSYYDKYVNLTDSQFYAPNAHFKNGEKYAFFRNPHLSQLEDVLLECYYPGEDNWRKLLFGSLQRVVMVDAKYLVPMCLGGADFDGDGVKIIKDKYYCDAVKESNEIKVMPDNKTKRVIKVVDIPAPKGVFSPKNDEERIREMLLATFNSRTGYYSNRGFEFALKAYTPTENDNAEQEQCRKVTEAMTAIVGLEIDSAKNGAKPDANIDFDVCKKSNSIKHKETASGRYPAISVECERSNFIKHKEIFKKQKKNYSLGDIDIVSKDTWKELCEAESKKYVRKSSDITNDFYDFSEFDKADNTESQGTVIENRNKRQSKKIVSILESYFPVKNESNGFYRYGTKSGKNNELPPVERIGFLYSWMKLNAVKEKYCEAGNDENEASSIMTELKNASKKVRLDNFNKSSVIFGFENDSKWKSRLDRDTLCAVIGLMLAYKATEKNIYYIYKYRNNKNAYYSTPKDTLSRILENQGETNLEKIENTINYIISDDNNKISNADLQTVKGQLYNVNGKEKKDVWQYGNGVLAEYLKEEDGEQNNVYSRLDAILSGKDAINLGNFKYGGYNLLYYLADAVQKQKNYGSDLKSRNTERYTEGEIDNLFGKLYLLCTLKKKYEADNKELYKKAVNAVESDLYNTDPSSYDSILSALKALLDMSDSNAMEETVKSIKNGITEEMRQTVLDSKFKGRLKAAQDCIDYYKAGLTEKKNIEAVIKKHIKAVNAEKKPEDKEKSDNSAADVISGKSEEIQEEPSEENKESDNELETSVEKVIEKKKEYLAKFENIKTDFEHKSDSMNILNQKSEELLKELFAGDREIKYYKLKKKELKYIYFASSKIDSGWTFMRQMCSGIMISETYKYNELMPLLTGREYSRYSKSLKKGSSKPQKESKEYTAMIYRGIKFYKLRPKEDRKNVQ